MATWHPVGTADAFFDGHASAVTAGGLGLVVIRLGDDLHALRDRCTHGLARLSDGWVEDGCIECPLHQGRFDIRTGAPRCAPVTEAVQTYAVRVVEGVVEVESTPRSH